MVKSIVKHATGLKFEIGHQTLLFRLRYTNFPELTKAQRAEWVNTAAPEFYLLQPPCGYNRGMRKDLPYKNVRTLR